MMPPSCFRVQCAPSGLPLYSPELQVATGYRLQVLQATGYSLHDHAMLKQFAACRSLLQTVPPVPAAQLRFRQRCWQTSKRHRCWLLYGSVLWFMAQWRGAPAVAHADACEGLGISHLPFVNCSLFAVCARFHWTSCARQQRPPCCLLVTIVTC